MSIGTQGITEHRVPHFRDATDVIARLAPTVSCLAAVQEFLRRENPTWKETHQTWTAVEDYTYFACWGPGSFSVMFGTHIAEINPGIRYSVFLERPSLRSLYVPVIETIARALGGMRLVIKSDLDNALGDESIYLNNGCANFDECIGRLRQSLGEPLPQSQILAGGLEKYTDLERDIWFLENLGKA